MIAIRAAGLDDAGAIAAIYAPHVVDGFATFETDAPDAAAMAARVAASDGLYPWLVAADENGDAVLGYAYAGRYQARAGYRWSVETTVYVAGDAQGRGVGRRLYEALIDTLAAQGFAQAIARIALPNDASVALHERRGFRCAGVYRAIGCKHGRWIDVGVWQRRLATPAAPPAEPRRFAAIGVVRG